jgi:hypothetical protein
MTQGQVVHRLEPATAPHGESTSGQVGGHHDERAHRPDSSSLASGKWQRTSWPRPPAIEVGRSSHGTDRSTRGQRGALGTARRHAGEPGRLTPDGVEAPSRCRPDSRQRVFSSARRVVVLSRALDDRVRGRRCTRPPGPRTSQPCRSHMWATTPMSWVMKRTAMPTRVGTAPCMSVEDLRLDGDVEGGRGLVGDQQVGLAGEAMAIMTRWRMPPESSWG